MYEGWRRRRRAQRKNDRREVRIDTQAAIEFADAKQSRIIGGGLSLTERPRDVILRVLFARILKNLARFTIFDEIPRPPASGSVLAKTV